MLLANSYLPNVVAYPPAYPAGIRAKVLQLDTDNWTNLQRQLAEQYLSILAGKPVAYDYACPRSQTPRMQKVAAGRCTAPMAE